MTHIGSISFVFWKLCIFFAHQVTYSSVIYLKQSIKEHLTSFKTYPNARILQKHHYLVHLPTQILMCGPLIRSWCMRFEGKNFKNLPLSLPQRHKSMESASLEIDGEGVDSCPLVSDDITFGKEKRLFINLVYIFFFVICLFF